MSEQQIIEQLETLSELEAQRAVIASEWGTEIARLEAFQDEACADVDEAIKAARKDIKSTILAHGKSAKGSRLQASFTKGRIRWDDKALCGYATAGHPELFAFRHEGNESCSIRVRR